MTRDTYRDFKTLGIEKDASTGVLELLLRSDNRLNALSRDTHRDLAHIWPRIEADEDVQSVLVRGDGEAFSAGVHLDDIEQMTDDDVLRAEMFEESRALVYNILNLSKPLVAAMHGVAVGAGLVVGVLADVSVATRDCRIVDGHTRLGVAAGDHAVLIWPLLIGMAKAKYYLLTCEPMSGDEAERIGLISIAVDDEEEMLATARRIASDLAGDHHARHLKQKMNDQLRSAGPLFDASLAMEFLGFAGSDVREGIAAIKEKRAPDFPSAR